MVLFITPVVDFARSVVDWFISTVPNGFKLILFLLFLFLVGNAVNNVFTADLTCLQDDDTSFYLTESLVSTRTHEVYFNSQIFLANITRENLTNAGFENSTTDGILGAINGIGLRNIFTASASVLSGDFLSFNFWAKPIDIAQRIIRPENFYCQDLFDNLDDQEDLRTELGLFDGCTVDDLPSVQTYVDTTFGNSTGEINQIFKVKCLGENKEITAFGFPFLDWKFWFVILALGVGLTFGAKWRTWLDMH